MKPMKPPVVMIQITDNPISQYYKNKVLKSWREYDVMEFDAITPETLNERGILTFDKKKRIGEFSDTEKACFESHMECWVMARKQPLLIIEHDIRLLRPIPPEIWTYPMAGLCWSGEKLPRRKLPCGAYYLTPRIAKELVRIVKGHSSYRGIHYNPDAIIHNLMDKVGYWDIKYCTQIQDPEIGNTIQHTKVIEEER